MAVAGRNFVGDLNELCQGRNLRLPTYEVVDDTGPPHLRKFVQSVEITGRGVYVGMPRGSLKYAKQSAAEVAWKALTGEGSTTIICAGRKRQANAVNYMGALHEYCSVKRIQWRCDNLQDIHRVESPGHSSLYVAAIRIGQDRVFGDPEPSKKTSKQNAARHVLEMLAEGQPIDSRESHVPPLQGIPTSQPPSPHCTLGMRPRCALNELCQKFEHLFEEPDTRMDAFQCQWHAKLKLAGKSGKAKTTFEGSHTTKKEAIEIAAQKAYEWMVRHMHTNSELLKPVICEDDRPLADRIASCCQDLFEKLCRNVIRAPSSSDVIAAFLLHDTTTGEMEIVALASGSKCIRGRHLSDEGLAVQDCHAEIVARRAFLRYLYQELEKLPCAPEECIFELIKKSGKIRLKPQYEVHLYINKPPCGDATNFTRAGKEDGTRWETEPHQPCWQASSCKNVRKMGLLRKKIECGEGGVLLDAGNLDCLQQDWEKLTSSISLSSDNPEYRLRTMSCSDKILKWNRVGVQGAALSMIVQPIFLVSLFIGDEDLFHHGHIVRGVCCRFTSPMLSNSLPSAKKMNHPKLVSVHSPVEARNYTDNTADFSLNWYKGAPEPECVDTDTGKAMPLPYISDSEPLGSKEYTPSQLCKRELFAIFHQTYKRVHKKPFPGNKTYSEAKKTAGKYQKVKEQFYEDLLNSGCGTWDKKPAQVDDFRI